MSQLYFEVERFTDCVRKRRNILSVYGHVLSAYGQVFDHASRIFPSNK